MLFNYTTELRNYIEQLSYPSDNLSHRQMIEAGRTKLFDFDYEIFDSNYKKIFETNFIRKFYMRQIGFETVGLFKFQLETWMLINMPYFNKLFESELLQYDPLSNTKTDETYTKTNDKIQNDKRLIEDTKIIDGEVHSDSNRIGTATNTENSTITKNEDSSTTNTENSTVTNNEDSSTTNTQNSNVNNKESSSKDSSSENNQTKDETLSLTDDNFNRQLESETPDGRLTLTASDGVGVIEYASKIKENNENNSKTTNGNTTNNITESSHENSDNESTVISENDSSSIVDSETVATSVNDSTSIFENDSTVVSVNDETTQTNDNLVDNTKSNVTQNDTKNDELASSINNVEDFVQHRVGKIGAQSFAKLIQEYRSSLLRIENKMFEEMSELFMLVY